MQLQLFSEYCETLVKLTKLASLLNDTFAVSVKPAVLKEILKRYHFDLAEKYTKLVNSIFPSNKIAQLQTLLNYVKHAVSQTTFSRNISYLLQNIQQIQLRKQNFVILFKLLQQIQKYVFSYTNSLLGGQKEVDDCSTPNLKQQSPPKIQLISRAKLSKANGKPNSEADLKNIKKDNQQIKRAIKKCYSVLQLSSKQILLDNVRHKQVQNLRLALVCRNAPIRKAIDRYASTPKIQSKLQRSLKKYSLRQPVSPLKFQANKAQKQKTQRLGILKRIQVRQNKALQKLRSSKTRLLYPVNSVSCKYLKF